MLNMLQQVMLEEKRDRAISPSFSPHHDWSAEVKAKSFHSLVFSKLVVATNSQVGASFTANTESLGSHILRARLGSKLKNAVENPNLLNTLKSHPNYLNEAYYLSDANISNEIAKRSILLTSLDKIDAYHDRTQAAVDEYFRALSLGMIHLIETTEPEVLKNNAYEMLLNARGENVYLISPARSVVGKFIEALEAHKGQFEGTYSQIRLINTLNKLYKQTQGEFAVFSTRRAWYQYRLSQAYESLQPSVSESNEAEDDSISKGQEDPKREALRSRRSLIHGNRKFQR